MLFRVLLAITATAAHAARVFRKLPTESVSLIEESSGSLSLDSWIPITSAEHGKYFYNPQRHESVRVLPPGATFNLQVKVSADEPGEPVPTIVPLGQRKSCVPHCTWNCTRPVCEQHCEPHCEVPECETRCPKPTEDTYKNCRVNCGQPDCAMFCPKKDMCPPGKKTLDCTAPKCRTQCTNPRCRFHCPDADIGCKTVCPQPKCEWKCHKPRECPKPLCKMICEQAPDCGRQTIPVPIGDREMVITSGRAHQIQNGWNVGNWSECSEPCGNGTQTRSVSCADPDGVCNEPRPANQRSCTGDSVCSWTAGPWGKCDKPCTPEGRQSRQVYCPGHTCEGPKPRSERSCSEEDDPLCKICKVTIYGGGNLGRKEGKWHLRLGPGKYSSSDLEHQGVKCDDISSVKVEGHFCSTVVYEYGDFNKQHQGFKATLEEGEYDRDALAANNVKDNDISSLEVINKAGSVGLGGAVAFMLAVLSVVEMRAH